MELCEADVNSFPSVISTSHHTTCALPFDQVVLCVKPKDSSVDGAIHHESFYPPLKKFILYITSQGS